MQRSPGEFVIPELEEREAFGSDFDAIKISIASPEKIRAWSHGEVNKAETINYRTLKPERGGLFCAQIFGPVNDWECLCGKYKRMKHRGVVCDKCGVEVTQASVRRSRLGHIELACPVSHVWFFKVPPSRIGQILDLTPRELERVLYYESYVVLEPGDIHIGMLKEADVRLSDDEFEQLRQLFAFSGKKDDEGWRITTIRGTNGRDRLWKGQVVTEEQNRILQRYFGRTHDQFRRKWRRQKARAPMGHEPLGDILLRSDEDFEELVEERTAGRYRKFEKTFVLGMGAEAAKRLLREADLDTLTVEQRFEMRRGWALREMPVTLGRAADHELAQCLRGARFDDAAVANQVEGKSEAWLAHRLRHILRHEMASVHELNEVLDLSWCGIAFRKGSIQKRAKSAKRLRVIEGFRKSGNLPEWMIMEVLPVIPPDLRPLVPLDGGRFATSDLNELYRKVINRNNRLRRLLELKAPEVIVRNEKRMLQEAVDALLDNGRRGRVLKGTNNRPLKSLSDTLKGKQGRFRQNLLGKRVDYSGRSVIVVGPELQLHQCGLPKKMALELFKPFLFNRLEHEGEAVTIKQARELVEQQEAKVWDFLDEVISEHSVLLNRAPTLHRLGIQAFEPVLVEGKAIRIHPLVCSAFNADFDGDQMAVHVPLSPESQVEAALLMRSSRNILSPAHGGPLAVPTQDMVLGIYYLSKPQVKSAQPPARKAFASADDVMLAHAAGDVSTLTPIWFRHTGEVLETHDSQDLLRVEPRRVENERIDTTVGRVLLNDALPHDMPFVNGVLKKKGIQNLVRFVYLRYGQGHTSAVLDALKDLGFEYSTRSGTSIGLGDLVVPPNKARLVEEAKVEVARVEEQYQQGAITGGERYNKVIDVWSNATNRVAEDMLETMQGREEETGRFSPVFMMVDSGARGSEKQIRQLAGMRGLMAKTSGEIIETPITSNFREGLSVIQYFISTNGARKGLADTALRTADAGYLTRRLADVAQDVIVTEQDCGTDRGIRAEPIIEAGEVIEPLRERIVGRVSVDEIKDFRGDVIVNADQEIDEDISTAIENSGVPMVKIRSVLTCETRRGICVMCYGRNLATGRMVDLGEAVGIIAAQSIGEPGTQLTMRTFHIGGTASVFENSALEARNEGVLGFSENLRTVTDRHGTLVVINRKGSVEVRDDDGHVLESHPVSYGARVQAAPGGRVEAGQTIVESDTYSFSILTEEEGVVRFRDIIADVTMIQEVDNVTFRSQPVIIESQDDRYEPRISIEDRGGNVIRTYLMPSRAHLEVEEGQIIRPGDVLAKIPRETTKTKDITGGLPRVVELFEARAPKAPALISEIDGRLSYGDVVRGKRQIIVRSIDTGTEKIYEVPRGVHISVREGEEVRHGDPLMDGPRNPHDILDVLGPEELQRYLIKEIQEVYRLQGVVIDDKHIEVIISRMMRWVKIPDRAELDPETGEMTDPIGDTDLIAGDIVSRQRFEEANAKAMSEGGLPAMGRPALLGLTKASLKTDSFISAASFQETTKVLTEASLEGKVDYLRGLKENVIMGRLIPAGTGLAEHQQFVFPEDMEAQRPLVHDAADVAAVYTGS